MQSMTVAPQVKSANSDSGISWISWIAWLLMAGGVAWLWMLKGPMPVFLTCTLSGMLGPAICLWVWRGWLDKKWGQYFYEIGIFAVPVVLIIGGVAGGFPSTDGLWNVMRWIEVGVSLFIGIVWAVALVLLGLMGLDEENNY